jgi:hypothetical protein
MASKKFTAEQLSRIMSAHDAGDLKRYGMGLNRECVCVLQAAHGAEAVKNPMWYGTETTFLVANGGYDDDIVDWFDASYDTTWTADEFLAQLEARGLA